MDEVMTSTRERLQTLLDEQGYVPASHPDVRVVYEILDEHYERVATDLATARATAYHRIMDDLGSWYRDDCPGWWVKDKSLIGWLNPQIVVRDSNDNVTFPTHHTQQEMADFASSTIEDFRAHERQSLNLHVAVHSHWSGHIAQITTNGRHRAAIFRAGGIPLVQCQITAPRNGLRRFIPRVWTEREDRLMAWLSSQDLVTRFTHPDHKPSDPWGGATYAVPHGSPIPWLLLDGTNTIDRIPDRIESLERSFGPIPDDRIDRLRTPRGIRSVCGPRPGTIRAFAHALAHPEAQLTPTAPNTPSPREDPMPAADPMPGRHHEIPSSVLTALIEDLPASTAARIDPEMLHPGDPFGRVLAWLWAEGLHLDAVELVQGLHTHLTKHVARPFWDQLLWGVRISLPDRGITREQKEELLEELHACSPDARIASTRPEPDALNTHPTTSR